MITKYKVFYDTGLGYTTCSQEFGSRSQAADFAQRMYEQIPSKTEPKIWENHYREDNDPITCEHCDVTLPEDAAIEELDCLVCEECHENCPHEWDMSEGGMCLNCGRDDYYNYIGD